MPHEPVTVAILTRDEPVEPLRECLEAVLEQLAPGDELVLVVAGGSPALLSECERAVAPRVRLHAFPTSVSPGEARTTALEMARHDVVAFLHAGCVPARGWLEELRRAIANADVAYGQQVHAPARSNPTTVARGLRDRRFRRDEDALPETYASHANAAFRRFAFETIPPEEELPAADDRAFARRARLAGLRIAYAPEAIVKSRFATDLKGAWRRELRVGAAHAIARDVLGAPRVHLAWAMLVGILGILAIALANVWLFALTLIAFFAPSLARLVSPVARRYRAHQAAAGAAVSPFLDMALVGGYLTRRARRRSGGA